MPGGGRPSLCPGFLPGAGGPRHAQSLGPALGVRSLAGGAERPWGHREGCGRGPFLQGARGSGSCLLTGPCLAHRGGVRTPRTGEGVTDPRQLPRCPRGYCSVSLAALPPPPPVSLKRHFPTGLPARQVSAGALCRPRTTGGLGASLRDSGLVLGASTGLASGRCSAVFVDQTRELHTQCPVWRAGPQPSS